jgi:hypothetical protein
VDHLDAVHQSREGFLDSLWCSIVKWFDELLKGLKVLHVVFRLIQGLCHSELNASPFGGGKVDLVSWFRELLRWCLGSLSQSIVHSSAVFTAKLLRNAGELPHSLFPEVELLLGTRIFIVFSLSIIVSAFKRPLDLLAPLVEDLLEIVDHCWIRNFGSVLGLVLPFPIELLERDVGLEALESLPELNGELLEDRVELFLLLVLADTPRLVVHPVDQRFVNLVDDGVQ